MACNLRPFRDYDEHDVINLFALAGGAGTDVTAGHFVNFGVGNAGWMNSHAATDNGLSNPMLGDAGQAYNNTVSQRYGVSSRVDLAVKGDTDVLGMTLYDLKETDENGEKLLYNPRKAAENDWVISGQAMPIVTRGIFLYSGTALKDGGNAAAGVALYVNDLGELATDDEGGTQVGICLGDDDDNGHVLVRINL